MSSQKKVHIIVPFVSVNDYVLECVHHILNLDYENYFLILVSNDEINLEKHQIFDERIKVLTSGNQNISFKRNLALTSFSEADYFAFIDSDAYPERRWLKEALKEFSDGTVGAVGGPNITPLTETLKYRVVGHASQSFLLTGGNSFRKRIAPSRYCQGLPTCNLIISKESLNLVKEFDESLFTGEDIDFCDRLLKAGKKIYYSEHVIVYHHNRPLLIPFVKQRFIWGMSSFKLIKRNFKISKIYLFLPFLFLMFLALGFALTFYSTAFSFCFLFVIFIYLGVVTIESCRWSPTLYEFPGTMATMILGNLVPGLGVLYFFKYLFSRNRNYEEFGKRNYQNFISKN